MLQKVMGLLRVVVTPMTLMVFSNAFSQETWETYNSTNSGFKGNRVQGIAIDSQGSKWFGTQTAGVNVFDGSAWVNYTTDAGLANDNVYVVTIDSDGNKWLGTNGGVSLFDGSSWASYTAPTIAHNKVNSVAIDSEKNVWLATKEGVSKFDGQGWVNFGSDVLGSDYEYAQAVIVDLDGKIWFLERRGAAY